MICWYCGEEIPADQAADQVEGDAACDPCIDEFESHRRTRINKFRGCHSRQPRYNG